MRITPLVIILSVSGSLAMAADQNETALRPFLNSYCIRCHGPQTQKADRRFDELSFASMSADDAELLQDILDQLNLVAMPPEAEKQPPEAEVKRVVARLTTVLAKAREAARKNVGKVVMRRLNRSEYRNTIRDLFQLKMVDFDPTTTFPADDSTEGFDNVGEGLVTSDHLLRNYLEAARKVADKAIQPGPRPQMIHHQAGGDAGADSPQEVLNGVSLDKEGRKEAGRLFIKFRQPLGLRLLDRKRGVPADGEYVIRFSAKAVRRKSRY